MLTPQGPHTQDVHSRETLLTSSSLQLLQLQVHHGIHTGLLPASAWAHRRPGVRPALPITGPRVQAPVSWEATLAQVSISQALPPRASFQLSFHRSQTWSEGSIFSCSFPLYPEDISLIYLLHASSQFGICFPEDA